MIKQKSFTEPYYLFVFAVMDRFIQEIFTSMVKLCLILNSNGGSRRPLLTKIDQWRLWVRWLCADSARDDVNDNRNVDICQDSRISAIGVILYLDSCIKLHPPSHFFVFLHFHFHFFFPCHQLFCPKKPKLTKFS